MKSKAILVVVLVLVLLASTSICSLKLALALEPFFFDDFNGSEVDTEKWTVQESTDWSGYPANGGLINVEGSKVYLSSSGSSFPCISSAANPFPTTGDFAVEFDLTYSCISDWGVGIWITKGPFEYKNESANNQIILQLWAGALDFDKVSIKGYFLVEDIQKPFAYESVIYGWEPSAPTHVFRLTYINGTYSLIDNGVTVASAASQLRPDTIGFGHPPVYWLPFSLEHVRSVMGGFGSFNIDYIKIEGITSDSNTNNIDKPQFSLSTNLEEQQIGYQIDIRGRLEAQEGKPIPSKQIILWYSIPGISTWYPITSVTTDAEGRFSASWIPTATGTFTIKAEYTDNTTAEVFDKTTNISVTPILSDDFYVAVESNSTLSSVTFNSTSNEFFFTVSGPSKTTGYTTLSVPKSFLPNPANLKLYIDGQQTAFNCTSEGNFWILNVNYSHSTHDVVLKIIDDTVESTLFVCIAAAFVIFFCVSLAFVLATTFRSSNPKTAVKQKP